VNVVLIVGGEPQQVQHLEGLILDQGHRVVAVREASEAARRVRDRPPSVVVLAIPVADADGLAALSMMHESAPKLPVVILTAGGSTDEAIEATKAGAFDYLIQPCPDDEIVDVVGEAVEAGRAMGSQVRFDQTETMCSGDALVGRSRPMREVYKVIGRVAPTSSTVLVRGESGTGKELVARAVYQHSTRANRPFVIVNCVAIPETLLESELFGYEKGAFTGAVSRRIGKVEHADGGTLFLDEIGDMPLPVQAKILRLLQDRKVERLGSHRSVPVDVRIIAATNRDLEAAIGEGRFRKDLYYRLNVVSVSLPALRDRRDDIALLADYFMSRLTRELGVRNPGLTAEAYRVLESHDWPGNVRELGNAMEKCLIFCRGNRVGAEEVAALVLGRGDLRSPENVIEDEALGRWIQRAVASGRTPLLPMLVDHLTKRAIQEALRMTGGNRSRAAAILGLSRPTLLAKISKYGLG
jgi:DNA-binding NtrC family response regulator